MVTERMIKEVVGEDVTVEYKPDEKLEIILPNDKKWQIVPFTTPTNNRLFVSLHVIIGKREFDVVNIGGRVGVANSQFKIKLFDGFVRVEVEDGLVKIVAEKV